MKNLHHGRIEDRRVFRPKRHNNKKIIFPIGGKECQLFLVAFPYSNLVVAGASIQGNEVEFPVRVPKILNAIRATWDGELEGSSDTIEGSVTNTQSPNKLINVCTRFLVWFSC